MARPVGNAPTSPALQAGAQTSVLRAEKWQPHGAESPRSCGGATVSRARPPLAGFPARLVVQRGNAPRSSAYQAAALLLSYRTEIGRVRVCTVFLPTRGLQSLSAFGLAVKMADGEGIAPPQPIGWPRGSSTAHCCSVTRPKVVLPEGLAPPRLSTLVPKTNAASITPRQH